MPFRASAGDSAVQSAVGVSPPSRTAHTHGAAAKADTVVIDTPGDHRHIDTTDGALLAHEPALLVAAADGSEPPAPARSLGSSTLGASVQDDARPAAKAGHTGAAVQADAIALEPALLCAAADGSGRPAPARSSGDLAAAQARGVGGSGGAPTFIPIDIVTDIAMVADVAGGGACVCAAGPVPLPGGNRSPDSARVHRLGNGDRAAVPIVFDVEIGTAGRARVGSTLGAGLAAEPTSLLSAAGSPAGVVPAELRGTVGASARTGGHCSGTARHQLWGGT